MKNLQVITLASALGLALLPSCAATKGLGQDLQKVGNRLENKADETGGAQPDPPTGIYTPPPTYPAAPSAY